MSTVVYLGDTVRVSVVFRDFEGELEDPVTLVGKIIELPMSATPNVLFETFAPVKTGIGQYYFDYTPTATGDLLARYVATFSDSSTDTVDQDIVVVDLTTDADMDGIPDYLQVGQEDLGEDFVLEFAAGLDPLYCAPDQLQLIFPDATLLEVAEYIHLHSIEVRDMLNLQEGEMPDTLICEYIEAAAACDLSRIYSATDGMSFGGETVRLGDLSVSNLPGGAAAGGGLNRGSASTWCELAAALRKELLFNSTNGKPFVHGSAYCNPIPERKIRTVRQRRSSRNTPRRQGRLDG